MEPGEQGGIFSERGGIPAGGAARFRVAGTTGEVARLGIALFNRFQRESVVEDNFPQGIIIERWGLADLPSRRPLIRLRLHLDHPKPPSPPPSPPHRQSHLPHPRQPPHQHVHPPPQPLHLRPQPLHLRPQPVHLRPQRRHLPAPGPLLHFTWGQGRRERTLLHLTLREIPPDRPQIPSVPRSTRTVSRL